MGKLPKRTELKVNVKTILISCVLGIVGYLVIISTLLYMFNLDNALIRLTYKIFPYPSAIIGNQIITIEELKVRVTASKRFYSNQDFSDLGARVDFSTPDGKKRLKIKEKYILTKMIEDKIIEKEASKLGLKVTAQMVSEEVEKKLEEYGTRETVIADVNRLYGWNLEDFKEKIVKPDIYKEKIYEYLRREDENFLKSKEKITKAWNELESGKSFSEVVRKYSEGESVKSDGDLGWFRKEEMLPEIAGIAFNLEKGRRSEILESRLGYHIIEIEDKQKEGDIEKVKVKQIFIRTITLSDWLQSREKKYKIYIPMKDYYWNRENNQVEFSQEELRKFEENVEKNSPDDISVLF